jgi:NAD(P)-dependent dehydrogenase (short-subunit alcohol dehydrogenase family)
MNNRIVLITGANSGIGKYTAKALAEMGATVVLMCRNLEKGQATIRELQQTATGPTDLIQGDLADFSSVKAAVHQFKTKYHRLDVLIHNAGIYSSNYSTTKDGFELQFGVNYLSTFLLTELLLDVLKASESARIIHVSSAAHRSGRIDFGSFKRLYTKKYSGMKAYTQSKICMLLYNKELSRRLVGTNITTNALHPGVVATSFGEKTGNSLFKSLWNFGKIFFIPSQKGAETSIYLASSPKVETVTGKYFIKKREKKPSNLVENEELRKILWMVSEQYIEPYL